MQKKMILVLLMATLLAGGVFAQISMSAGIGGNFGVYMESWSHPDFDIDNPKPVIGGGFHAFFDASYATLKVGMFIGGTSEEDELDFGFGDPITMKMKMSYTYFSLGVLGKYPIDLGGFTLFPMLGFEYNMFLSAKATVETDGESESETLKRADLGEGDGKTSDADMFILQLGVGADFNLSDNIYLRPTLLWGIDLKSTEYEKDFKDNDGKIFKHKLDIGIAVGFKF